MSEKNLIDAATVKKVAFLARLQLSEQEIPQLAHELDLILQRVHQIEKLDLDDILATSHAVQLMCPTREDIVQNPLEMNKVLLNAPEKEATAFKVPRIIGEE